MNNLPLIDLSQPHYITESAARFYVPLYQRVLETKAAGRDIREALPVEGAEAIVPKSVTFNPGERLPNGEVDRWGRESFYDWSFRNGVATIDVRGPIIRYATLMSAMSGLASTSSLATQLQEAVNHPSVHTILLAFDSPGGSSNGVAEVADRIFELSQIKPIYAYADGTCCSAAYFFAAACNQVFISRSGVIGSIGAVLVLQDDSKLLEKEGIKEYVYISSNSPNKWAKPGTKNGDSQFQRLVDDSCLVFGDCVARYRGVSLETVWSKFGGGAVFTGQNGVTAGLADGMTDFETLHAELVKRNGKRVNRQKKSMSTQNNGVNNMSANPLASLFGSLFALTNNPQLATAGIEVPQLVDRVDATDEVPPSSTAPANTAPVVPSQGDPAQPDSKDAEIARLRAELQASKDAENARIAKAEEDRKAAEVAQKAADLDAFMSSVSSKVPPAHHEELKALYAKAQEGNASAEDLKAFFSKATIHSAMAPVAPADAPAASVTVPTPDEGDVVSEERKAELLSKTPLGREILDDKKS